MKPALLSLMILCASHLAHAQKSVKTRINCQGPAEIQGMLFMKTVDLRLELNAVQDPYGNLGHRAFIDQKAFIHAPDVSSCKETQNEILCRGAGVGNGPELLVKIDKRSREASGYYFNPWARRIGVQNESNTYRFDRLICD